MSSRSTVLDQWPWGCCVSGFVQLFVSQGTLTIPWLKEEGLWKRPSILKRSSGTAHIKFLDAPQSCFLLYIEGTYLQKIRQPGCNMNISSWGHEGLGAQRLGVMCATINRNTILQQRIWCAGTYTISRYFKHVQALCIAKTVYDSIREIRMFWSSQPVSTFFSGLWPPTPRFWSDSWSQPSAIFVATWRPAAQIAGLGRCLVTLSTWFLHCQVDRCPSKCKDQSSRWLCRSARKHWKHWVTLSLEMVRYVVYVYVYFYFLSSALSALTVTIQALQDTSSEYVLYPATCQSVWRSPNISHALLPP